MDSVEKPGLVDRDIDHVVACFQEEIGFFWGFNAGGEQYRPAARSTDTKITTPLIDIFKYFRGDGDFSEIGRVQRMRMHDANSIGRLE